MLISMSGVVTFMRSTRWAFSSIFQKVRISCLTSSSIRGPFVLILLILLSLGRSWHQLHFTYALPRAAAYPDRARAGTRNRSKRSSVRYRFSSVSYIVESAFHALG